MTDDTQEPATRYVELLIAIDTHRPELMRFYVTRNLTISSLAALARDLETADDGGDIEGVLALWAQLRDEDDHDSTAKHEAAATTTAPRTVAATARRAADHFAARLRDWASEASRGHRADGGRWSRLMLALRRQRGAR